MRCPVTHAVFQRRKSGRPPVLSEEERRRIILAAAEAAFFEQGYGATSMDDVARRCAMSKKTLYRSFATKESLFQELIGTALRSLPDVGLPPGEQSLDARKALAEALRSMLEMLLHPRQLALARLVVSESAQAPELAATLHEQGLERSQHYLDGVVAGLRSKGLLRPETGEELGVFLLDASIGDWAFMFLIGRVEAPSPEQIAERVERVLDTFGRAIFSEQDSQTQV